MNIKIFRRNGDIVKADVFKVEGMVCGHCEVAVQEAVRKLRGIKKVKAIKRKKEAMVEYDEAEVNLDQIIAAVNATGYQATK